MQGSGGGEVYDASPAPLDHFPNEGAACQVRSNEVGAQRLNPALRIAVLDQLNRAENAGGVHENGDWPAEPVDLLAQALDCCRLGDIRGNRPGVATRLLDLPNRLVQFLRVARNGGDWCSMGGEVQRGLASQASTCA